MIMAENSGEKHNIYDCPVDIKENKNCNDPILEIPLPLDITIESAFRTPSHIENFISSAPVPDVNDAPRREENPFSFKHFLKRDPSQRKNGCSSTPSAQLTEPVTTSYHNTGARPKVFPSPLHPQPPLTLSLESHQHMKKSKHIISLDNRFKDFQQEDYNAQNPGASKSSSASVEVSYSNQNDSMNNLYDRSHSEINTTYGPSVSPDSGSVYDSTSSFRHQPQRLGSTEFSSALPDFVQDHIVLEQWYSGFTSPHDTNIDFDKIPDFTLTDKHNTHNRHRLLDLGRAHSEILPSHSNLPCDLTSDQGSLNRRTRLNNPKSVPLDLPSSNIPFDLMSKSPNKGIVDPLDLTGNVEGPSENVVFDRGFPLDLPVRLGDDPPNSAVSPVPASNDVTQRLPDFLSDGPIHSGRIADVAQNSVDCLGGPDNIDDNNDAVSRFSLENDRLRKELEAARAQIAEQTQQISRLSAQLTIGGRDYSLPPTAQITEDQYNARLCSAMKTVEDNLAHSNKRATEAESNVAKLKKQVKQLTKELSELQRENTALQLGEASCSSSSNPRARRISQDLRQAATVAEQSLRQLMSGVENLRALATSLDHMDRIPDITDDFMFDEDKDEAGPAL